MNSNPAELFRKIQGQARARGINMQQQLELYIHERFLARIAVSDYSNNLILKGGMLLAALDIRSLTRDADISAHNVSNEIDSVKALITDLGNIELSDDVLFHTDNISIEVMRESAEYHGFRIKIPTSFATANLITQIDLSFGDPLRGQRRKIPTMFGESFELLTYSVESVLAEKLVTMMERGEANTRDRDFGDIWLVTNILNIDGNTLLRDMKKTSKHRDVALTALNDPLLRLTKIRQSAWERYRNRTQLLTLPESFEVTAKHVAKFWDSLLMERTSNLIWNSSIQKWEHLTQKRYRPNC